MGSIKSGLFVSVDGVVEAPEEWHMSYIDDQMGAAVGRLMSEADATLLGRATYEGFAEYWPKADPDDPMTQQMNNARKFVVSSTLTEATWQNTTLISTDVAGHLRKLKQEMNLGVTGSVVLVRWLLEQRLLDELHLLVHPIVVGRGQRLFDDGPTVPLQLLSSATFDTGVVHLVYAPSDDE